MENKNNIEEDDKQFRFSEKINFKFNFKGNIDKDLSGKKSLLAKNNNALEKSFVFKGEPLEVYKLNENLYPYQSLEENWIKDIDFDYLEGKLFSYESETITKNDSPVDINISSFNFDENISSNSSIGKLITVDSDLYEAHTYSLISGNGDTDNDLFYISGEELFINHSPNYEWKSNYSIRLRSEDETGLRVDKILKLSANDLEDHGRRFYKGNNNLNDSNTWSKFSLLNEYINGLYTGYKWGNVDPDSGAWTDLEFYLASDETISFSDYGSTLTSGYFHPLSDIERSSYLSILESFSDVCKVTFRESKTYSLDDRNILLGSVDSSFWGISGLVGRANFPDGSADSGLTTMVRNWFSPHLSSLPNVYEPGSWLYAVAMHEVGHSMGLAHPHHYMSGGVFPGVTSSSSLGDNDLNSGPFTVMTYNFTNAGNYTPSMSSAISHPATCGCPTCLGAFDIAHLQYLYGPNPYTGRKNDTYSLNDSLKGFECIWDASGIDTINASSSSKSATIDLRNATLKNELGGGGFVSSINGELKGYTIAYNSTGDCIIENAKGSNFNDTITGNDYANEIFGLGGDDEIYARGGTDIIYGGDGNDVISGSFFGNISNEIDLLFGGAGSDVFVLGDNSGAMYSNNLSNDFANIKDFDILSDNLKLNNSFSYLTSITTQNDVNGLGIFTDNNSSGNIDSNDELIAILSNQKSYISIDKISTQLV